MKPGPPRRQEAGCKEASVNTEDAGKTPFRRSTGGASSHENNVDLQLPAPGAAETAAAAGAAISTGSGPVETSAGSAPETEAPVGNATQQMAASLAAMLSNALTVGAPGVAVWPTQPVPKCTEHRSGSSVIDDMASLTADEGCGLGLPFAATPA